ncbi:conserved hypothetical protein [Clostridium neonatale]|uniref:hypothetical protein n=1 Tax=Clostridium neonatale TaxID=137838 RepID=UPI001E0566EB|nr:hypothetical protein [Clostridium neonatale]CAG9702623.1 conserved hypothetical protein [Clostridium neonatale]
MIELKNIDLSNVTFAGEVNKYDEETNEFFEALHIFMYSKTNENKEHLIEEFWDTVQAEIGLLDKLGITALEVMQEYPKHLEKIKNRPRVKED